MDFSKITTIALIFLLLPLSGFSQTKKDLKIAIIGAGISGLTAAHYLKEKGFKKITIFEKEDQVGGKVLTKDFAGSLYELGGIWVFKEYKTILELINFYNIPLKRFPAKKTILSENGNRLVFFDYGLDKYDLLQILDSVIRIKIILEEYSSLKQPGLSNIPPELYDTFENFIIKNKLQALGHIMEPFIVGTGYPYFKDVPAVYYLKPTLLIFNSLLEDIINEKFQIPSNAFKFLPEGFQPFLETIASQFDVRLNNEVIKLERNTDSIALSTKKRTYTFDKVIISTSPDETLKFLDATPIENFLFSNLKSNFYQITAFRGYGLPKKEVVFLAKSTDKENRGTPAVFANWGKNNDIFIALTPFQGFIAPEILREKMENEVRDLGGEIDEILFNRGISYFFHYDKDFLKKYSPYQKIESLQGKLGTYFVGAYLNFESLENSAEYAKNLVFKYFD